MMNSMTSPHDPNNEGKQHILAGIPVRSTGHQAGSIAHYMIIDGSNERIHKK